MHPLLGQIETNERRPRPLDGDLGLSADLAALHDRDELGLPMQPLEPTGMLHEEPARKSMPVGGYREPGMAAYCERCGGIGGHVPGCPAEGAQGAAQGLGLEDDHEERPSLRRLLARILRGLAERIEGSDRGEL